MELAVDECGLAPATEDKGDIVLAFHLIRRGICGY